MGSSCLVIRLLSEIAIEGTRGRILLFLLERHGSASPSNPCERDRGAISVAQAYHVALQQCPASGPDDGISKGTELMHTVARWVSDVGF